MGRQATNILPIPFVIGAGAGVSVLRPDALPDGWAQAIILHPSRGCLRLRDANGHRLVSYDTKSLPFRAAGLVVACTFQVFERLGANGLHEIFPDFAFPVDISNFGTCEVNHRHKTIVGIVKMPEAGVNAMPKPLSAGPENVARVDIPVLGPLFVAEAAAAPC